MQVRACWRLCCHCCCHCHCTTVALATHITSLFLVALKEARAGGLLLLLHRGGCCCHHQLRLGWGSPGKTGLENFVKMEIKKGVPAGASALVLIQVSWSLRKAWGVGVGVGVGTVIVINTLVLGWWWPSLSLSNAGLGVCRWSLSVVHWQVGSTYLECVRATIST